MTDEQFNQHLMKLQETYDLLVQANADMIQLIGVLIGIVIALIFWVVYKHVI